MLLGSLLEAPAAGVDLAFGGVDADPILEAVDRDRRLVLVRHHQETGNSQIP